jgi:hypothetical protein
MAAIETEYPTITRQRTPAKERQRAPGGGRPCDLPLVIRVAIILFYLRTHVPQWLVALLFGATQSDVSRDLRRILPVLHAVLPSPAVWDIAPPPDAADAYLQHDAQAIGSLLRGSEPHRRGKLGGGSRCGRCKSA